MPGGRYGILEGREVRLVDDLMEWAAWYGTALRHVGLYETEELMVSTVFLGLDHGWGNEPMWFETMVFRKVDGDVDWTELDMDRCQTYEEAEEMHHRLVMKWDHPGEVIVQESKVEMMK